MAKKTKPKQALLTDQLISIDQAVSLTPYKRAWFERYLLYAGLVKKDTLNRIKLGDFTNGIIAYYKEKDDRPKYVTKEELKAAEIAKTLMSTQAVYEKIGKHASDLRAALEGVPAQVTRDLDLRKSIEEAIKAAFKRFGAGTKEDLGPA